MKIKENHKLRTPTGTYTVGVRHFTYTYTPDAEERIMPCLCFYPASDIGEGNLKKYVNERILPGTSGIETNAYINAPIAGSRHPLLLFNHGFSVGYEYNTVQFEELASHGYIVLSISHPGDGSYELPNGDVLVFDADKLSADFQADATASNELFPQYAAWLRDEGPTADVETHRAFYQKIIDQQPKMVAHTAVWLADSLFALDRLLSDADTADTWLYQHIDQDKIGAFGMSYGGSTAISLAHASERIKASANLDGFFFGGNWQTPINKPVLLLQNDSIGGLFLQFPYLNAAGDAYLVTVKDSTHSNFMDYNEILAENMHFTITAGDEEIELAMLGDIDPGRMEDIINMMLLDFFNKYLKGKDAPLIDTDSVPDDVTLIKK